MCEQTVLIEIIKLLRKKPTPSDDGECGIIKCQVGCDTFIRHGAHPSDDEIQYCVRRGAIIDWRMRATYLFKNGFSEDSCEFQECIENGASTKYKPGLNIFDRKKLALILDEDNIDLLDKKIILSSYNIHKILKALQ